MMDSIKENNDAELSATPSNNNEQPAPEPPRWRFIAEAKKSLGYSSLAAGTHVEGLTSDELGAKYIAPDISIYQHQKEAVQPRKVGYQLPSSEPFSKEDAEVGKLVDISLPPQSAFSSQNEVGKLLIDEASPNREQLPTGEFMGLPKYGTQPNESRDPFKSWGASVQVGPKKGRDHEWYDGDVFDTYTFPGEENPSNIHEEVGRLMFHTPGPGEDTFVGEIAKSNRDREKEWGDQSEDSYEARGGALFMHGPSYSYSDERAYNSEISTAMTERTNEQQKKKQQCLYLLLLLLLLLVIVLAVLLEKKNEEEVAVAASAVSGAVIPPIIVVNETNATLVPSSYPSEAPSEQLSSKPSHNPSTECPPGTKLLSISHLQHSEHFLPTSANDATWVIRSSCSKEVISRCLPCSSGSLSFPRPWDKSLAQFRSHGVENPLKDATECLPIDEEYVFEVLPAGDSEPCCGFDHTMSVISYDGSLIKYGVSDMDLFNDISSNVHFGERKVPCESNEPSVSPSIRASSDPSSSPTASPSVAPTYTPTFSPSTGRPTNSPPVLLGGCPEPFEYLSYYSVGTQVESNGIIFECTSFSCGSYGPGSTTSFWIWKVVGSCLGSRAPTSYPSKQPTPEPTTRQHTEQPTCSKEKDFNLCLAIDMSGSVCNDGNGSECLNCRASFLPIFFSSECKDAFVSEDTCCHNFATVQEFSSVMVNLLDHDFDAEKSFSVVQFATTAQLVSSRLSSAEQAVPVIGQLDYTGGLTNHASAIQTCQQSLPKYDGRKNFIMLITDGVSSEPDFDPEGAAEAAASSAKAAGTFIIPVFISAYNDWSARDFMRRLSSDGKLFDVTDFASLNSLQDRLVDQVSCS